MWNNYRWADVTYTRIEEDGTKKVKRGTACFSDLINNNTVYKEIILYDNRCKYTNKYRTKFMHYVKDMFKLDAEITEDYFKFKAFKCNKKNTLVLSAIRMLFETFGDRGCDDSNQHNTFFKPLFEGKSKYRNKLKRYCDFYQRIGDIEYFSDLHIWNPRKTKIKSTQDFIKTKELGSVNSFFYNE